MGFPLAALKLRLKRFCEVLVARSSLGSQSTKNRRRTPFATYLDPRPLKESSGSFGCCEDANPVRWFNGYY